MMQLLQKSEDAVCGWLRGIDAALLRTVAAAAALCMLLAHGFAFTNLFPNHDSTVLVFDAQWTMYVLGRWAQNLYFPLVRGKIAAPWLIGAFSIVYLALTGYIIAKLLHLRRRSACAAAWRCTNPTFSLRWGCTCCCFCNLPCRGPNGGPGCGRAWVPC